MDRRRRSTARGFGRLALVVGFVAAFGFGPVAAFGFGQVGPIGITPARAASEPLPACEYADVLTPLRSYAQWQTTFLDTTYKLPSSYAPADLVPVSRAGLSGTASVRSLLVSDLTALATDAATAGAPLAVASGYRSYTAQQSTFDYWVRVHGLSVGLLESARAGHSEHQLGTAIDFKSLGGPDAWDVPDWATTPAGAWMAAHAVEYGFVMSYPLGSPTGTCYRYEPWHFRYLGRTQAAAFASSGLTLRAWLWELQPHPMPTAAPATAAPKPTATPSPTPSPSPSPSPTSPPSAVPTTEPLPSPAVATESPAPAPAQSGGFSSERFAILVPLAVIVGAGAAVIVLRRRGLG